MKKIKIIITIIIFAIIIFLTTKTQAVGSVSLSSSKSKLKVGEEFTISVNLSGAEVATLTARVTADISKVQYISGPANSNFVNGKVIYVWTDTTGGSSPLSGGTIATFKFKAIAEGSSSFSVSGDFFSPDKANLSPSFSGTSVTIEKEEQPSQNTNTNTTPNTPTQPIENTVPQSANTTPQQPETSTNTNTNVNANTNVNTGGVTNPSTTTTTTPSTPTSNNQSSNESLDTNNNLKSLKLSIEGLTPIFNKNIANYTITVPNNISIIDINALPESSKANVTITGNNNLVVGMNKIIIAVTAENGNRKEYTINATKTDNPEFANASLENLAIEFTILEPAFNSDILEYNATVGSDVEALNVLAVPQRETASVTVTGNQNLQFGENVVTIRVVAENRNNRKNICCKSK